MSSRSEETSSHRNVADDLDRVQPFPAWCERCGFSEPTGRRLIKTGLGPVVTWLSPRRMGIRERHHREWLDARAQGSA
jgi:hypothetical protein